MHTQTLEYKVNNKSFIGYIAHKQAGTEKLPGVMIVHDWCGCDEFVQHKAQLMAEAGYVGFAVDMYGEGKVGQDDDEKGRLMESVLQNRQGGQECMLSALNALKSLKTVDPNRIGAIGYCFGGLCVLDLVRSGVDIKGGGCFHGILTPPDQLSKQLIKAKILALQGYNDPFVPIEQIFTFAEEMAEAKADWQLHMYGQARHSYTKRKRPGQGEAIIYNEKADKRSWQLMNDFLSEIFKL